MSERRPSHCRASGGIPYGVFLPETVLENVRIKYTNIGLMWTLWTDTDPAIRITSRSICALLASHILHKPSLRDSDLAWLQDVLGQSSNRIYNSLGDRSTVDNMNIDSFVYGALSYPTGDLPVESAASFVDTLAILMSAGDKTAIRRSIFDGGLSGLLRRAENDDRLLEVADQLWRISEAMFPPGAPNAPTSRR